MNEPVDPIAFLDPECRPILARMAAGRERRRNSAVSIAAIRTNAAALFAPWNAGDAKPQAYRPAPRLPVARFHGAPADQPRPIRCGAVTERLVRGLVTTP